MPFNMQEYQKNYQAKYRAKKKEEREQMKTEQTTEKPENLKSQSEDPSLSLEQKTENRLTPEQTKTVEEKIKPAPTKKNKKSGKIALNPQAFGNFSIGIEKTTLLIHKDKTLKEHEEQLIRTSAEQLAEIYEMPALIVVVQYIASMILPHVTRLISAQAEKIEIENESKKIDLEEKKKKVEEGRQKVKPEDVYRSIKEVQNGN